MFPDFLAINPKFEHVQLLFCYYFYGSFNCFLIPFFKNRISLVKTERCWQCNIIHHTVSQKWHIIWYQQTVKFSQRLRLHDMSWNNDYSVDAYFYTVHCMSWNNDFAKFISFFFFGGGGAFHQYRLSEKECRKFKVVRSPALTLQMEPS